ncbi:MAG TPA: hypothetical protein VJU86_18065, partial [Pyrinomonadaceae bacterium]|nr:hypothetical protein [Pyrinomonadaceae bacterium]
RRFGRACAPRSRFVHMQLPTVFEALGPSSCDTVAAGQSADKAAHSKELALNIKIGHSDTIVLMLLWPGLMWMIPLNELGDLP